MENLNNITIDIEIPYQSEHEEQLKQLYKYLKAINNCFMKDNKNFAELCFYVYNVRAIFYDIRHCFNKKGNLLQFKSIMDQIGLSESETSRLCSCYEKYVVRIENAKPQIFVEYSCFNKSKLIELLPVPHEQIWKDLQNKVLREDMSVQSIRNYVKNYKALEKQNKKLNEPKEEKQEEEFNIEEIPEAYNPKQHYDFDYFKDKSKAQLLNIVWDLQKEYEKLLKRFKEKK